MTAKQRKLRLSKRDQRILRHVARYGLTTPDILHQAYFPGRKRGAMLSTLRRLYGRPPRYRLLRPRQLFGKRKYCQLTRKGALLIDASEELARRFGIEARARRYALLWYMHEQGLGNRGLFNPRDFPQQFAVAGQRLPRKNFFIEETESGPKLGFIVIHLGGEAQRTARRCTAIVARLLRTVWFADYFMAERFVLSVLTITEGTRQELLARLCPHMTRVLAPLASKFGVTPYGELPLEIRVVVVPDLVHLVPGQRTVATQRKTPKARKT